MGILVAELEDLVQIFDEERRHLRRAVIAHEDLDARDEALLRTDGRPFHRQRLLVAGRPVLWDGDSDLPVYRITLEECVL